MTSPQRARSIAELAIDAEEDRMVRALLVGMLREAGVADGRAASYSRVWKERRSWRTRGYRRYTWMSTWRPRSLRPSGTKDSGSSRRGGVTASPGATEMDYLPELRRDRGIFVTSDQQHVDRIRAGRHKHPGVVFLDREWDREAKVALAGVMAETIKAAIAVLGSKGFYDIVLEPALGGLYYTEGADKKRLFMSWGRYFDAPLG